MVIFFRENVGILLISKNETIKIKYGAKVLKLKFKFKFASSKTIGDKISNAPIGEGTPSKKFFFHSSVSLK